MGTTMSKGYQVELRMTDHGKGTVTVDGHEVEVISATVHVCAGEPNTVTLELLADEVTFSGPAAVTNVTLHRSTP
jgi:hypothetical protein